jgi:hypothetical protein
MRRAQSFHEVLQETLRRAEKNPEIPLSKSTISATVADFPLLTWTPPEWQTPQKRSTYKFERRSRFERRRKPQSETRRVLWDKLTPSQQRAYKSLFEGKPPVEVREDEVSRRYRLRALECHPDRPSGCAEEFRALQANYQELKTVFSLLSCDTSNVSE